MQRTTFWILASALAAAGAAPLSLRAQEAPADPLPLRDVVLFSSGVGYFQRAGRVTGDLDVPLSFRTDQVNDILKSLVLFDGPGGVRPVTYTTKDALHRRLHPLGQGLQGGLSLGALLRQFQGARVRLRTGGGSVEGRIVSVSVQPAPGGRGEEREGAPEGAPGRAGGAERAAAPAVPVEVLNLLTESGLRAVPLASVGEVQLLDERLDRELRASLELLATGLEDERRTVTLHFGARGGPAEGAAGGAAAREVRAGYLQEMPLWKTTYRLVLGEGERPYLQGWALVENTTDEDWREVRLSLVSGRPVSFLQELYQPLYVPRPVVQAQVTGSPYPQTYGETLEGGREPGDARAERPAELKEDFQREHQPARARLGGAAARGGQFGSAARDPGTPAASAGLSDREFAMRRSLAVSAAQLAQTGAQAVGAERGELFEYAIRQPVSLPRQQAAMVPILGSAVGGEKLSLYEPQTDPAHALNGFRLQNTTGLHLAGGPLTVFQGGVYAGDAQIHDLRPGEDRLLSYAVDLDLAVGEEPPKFRQETLTLSARSGVLWITRKQQRERTYTVRNKTGAAKTVLVLQPLEREFRLVQPAAPAEKTAGEYRFRMVVPGQKTEQLRVVTERPVTEQLALLDADLNVLVAWARNGQVSERLRQALQGLVGRRQAITELAGQRAEREGELTSIAQEQSRIRQNMAQLDRNSALYQQYVAKLTDQEGRIERVRAEIARLREAETGARKGLQAFVDGLTLE